MKPKSFFKLIAISILTSIVLQSCTKDDDMDYVESTDSARLTCKIDGVTFTASKFNNTLIGDAAFKRLDIRATDALGNQLIITINDLEGIGTNFSHLEDTVFVDAFENTPLGIITLDTYMGSDNSILMTSGDGKEAGYSILKSCDLTENFVSGIFEFQLEEFGTNNIMYVTEGKFSNLKFTEF
jgi:hypothetical protein